MSPGKAGDFDGERFKGADKTMDRPRWQNCSFSLAGGMGVVRLNYSSAYLERITPSLALTLHAGGNGGGWILWQRP